jgi:predicted transglutaminase-like cysteine proteinase
MKNIFPGYVETAVPSNDSERAKWDVVRDSVLIDDPAMFSVSTWDVVEAINVSTNKSIEYRKDPGDRWQKPMETAALHAGDCEDFALLKWSLLNPPAKDVALVLGILGSEGGHAFLVIRIGDKMRVLDNKFDQLIAPADYLNFTPKKMFSADGSFLYAKPFRPSELVA